MCDKEVMGFQDTYREMSQSQSKISLDRHRMDNENQRSSHQLMLPYEDKRSDNTTAANTNHQLGQI